MPFSSPRPGRRSAPIYVADPLAELERRDHPAGSALVAVPARTSPFDGPSEWEHVDPSRAPRRISSSVSIVPRLALVASVDDRSRRTPLESGQAAVARRDVHIERVWPMRSSPTGPLEASSSAYFQRDRGGAPPAGSTPVGGLRMTQAFTHDPVLLHEVVELLHPVPPGLVVDVTLGGAGHTTALLHDRADRRVLGIDRDPFAISTATERLASFGSRAVVRRARFDQVGAIVDEVQATSGTPSGAGSLAGALFDLGVSSPQLDMAERGFSYRRDAPLDMRMDPTTGRTAADVVNGFDEEDLIALFRENGEGRFAPRIARAIIAARPILTTGELADVVRAAIPAATRRTGGHPARKVFQAVRIAVNEELDQLEIALDAVLDRLAPGGRCVVISYHSGEDRLVKSRFVQLCTDNCQCPPTLPCVCGADPQFRLVHRGARQPSAAEIARNPRSEAARLRTIERLTPTEER